MPHHATPAAQRRTLATSCDTDLRLGAVQGMRETYSLMRDFLVTNFGADFGRTDLPEAALPFPKEVEQQPASYGRAFSLLLLLLLVATTLAILVQLNLATVGQQIEGVHRRMETALHALASMPPLLTP